VQAQPVIVSVQEQRIHALVTVSDKSPALPVALPHEVTDLGGRGVSMVDQLSVGHQHQIRGGKSVWARFDKGSRTTTSARSRAERA